MKIDKIPCDSCIHKNVCTVRSCFEETEIKTTHPYIKVTLDCTEYMGMPLSRIYEEKFMPIGNENLRRRREADKENE